MLQIEDKRKWVQFEEWLKLALGWDDSYVIMFQAKA